MKSSKTEPPKKKSKVDDQITQLTEKTYRLEAKLEDMIKEVDIRNSERTFIFQIKDVQSFLNVRKAMRSERFYCNSVHLFLEVVSNCEKNGVKYVEFFCHVNESSEEGFDWKINIDLSFEIMHQYYSIQNKSLSFDNLVYSNKTKSWGKEFISHAQMIKFANNDEISFKVKVKASRLLKYKNM